MVYKVWDLKRNVALAMKVLHADFADDPAAFKSFLREAGALQKLSHPHIVPFYGLYQTDQFFFLVEQYIDGSSLREILRKHPGGMPIPDALGYMKALCSALGYAHIHGLVHCDVKPGNVMVDSGGHIYLADFGIVRRVDSATSTLAGSGSPSYMAPEQILRQSVTAATDIYALGILLFEILTGQRPFRGVEPETLAHGTTSGERIIYAHLNLYPHDPSELNPAIPKYLSAVILKAMSKSPQNRFASTGEMLGALGMAGYEETSVDLITYPPSHYPPISPDILPIRQPAWLIPFGVAASVIVLALLCWMVNIFSAVTVSTADWQSTYMAQQTRINVTQPVSPSVENPISAITETKTPIPAVEIASSPTSQPRVLMLESAGAADFSGLQSLADLSEEDYTLSDYNRVNETLKFTVNLSASQSVIWKANWCAKKKAILADNLQKMKFEFSLNGEDISVDRFTSKSYVDKGGGIMNGWSCLAYQAVLTNWQPGTYQIISKIIYLKPINDGKYSYPVGWQASLYNVMVK